jgi:hypothetical protein
MGDFDWRLLIVMFVIMLLLMSCTGQIIAPEATVTLMPSITLTVYLSQALSPTALGLATSSFFPTRPPVTPPPTNDQRITLNLPNPICYDNQAEGILCLGVVNNPYQMGFKDVQVLVELFYPNGTPLNAKATALLQHSLPPDGSAPYHVRFDRNQHISADNFGGVRVSVVNFTPLAHPPMPPAVILQDIINDYDNQHYRISGKLVNSHTQDRGAGVRMIITLYDSHDHVAGYRILEIPTIPAQMDMPFLLDFTPQIQNTALRYTIYLEQMP